MKKNLVSLTLSLIIVLFLLNLVSAEYSLEWRNQSNIQISSAQVGDTVKLAYRVTEWPIGGTPPGTPAKFDIVDDKGIKLKTVILKSVGAGNVTYLGNWAITSEDCPGECNKNFYFIKNTIKSPPLFVKSESMQTEEPTKSTEELHYAFTTISNIDVVEQKVRLFNGWNIIHGLANPDWILNGEISKSNIKYIYALHPLSKKYVKIYPDPQRKEVDELKDVPQMAFWIYSDKEGIMTYKTEKSRIFDLIWPTGWNLMPITEEMIPNEDTSIGDLTKNCKVEKIYSFNVRYNWNEVFLDNSLDREDAPHNGVVIKFSGSCKLNRAGEAELGVSSPPSMPGSTAEYIISENIGNFRYDKDNERVIPRFHSGINYTEHAMIYYLGPEGQYNQYADVSVRIFKNENDRESHWNEVLELTKKELSLIKKTINGVEVYESEKDGTRLIIWEKDNLVIIVSGPKTEQEIFNAYLNKYN